MDEQTESIEFLGHKVLLCHIHQSTTEAIMRENEIYLI